MPEPTSTAFSGVTMALCACCADHGDARLEPRLVTCIECGQQCSCTGCIAEEE